MSTEAGLHSDLDLALSVENLLWWTGYWRGNEIAVSVSSGWVTLSGVVDWGYQKRLAVHVLKDLPGLAGIVDHIAIKFDAQPAAATAHAEPGPTDDTVTFSRWR